MPWAISLLLIVGTLCRPSHSLRGCLCHPLFLSRLDRVVPASRMGHAHNSFCLFHLNHCRDFLLTRTSGCPNLESFYESWVSFAMWIIAILLYHRNALIARKEEALARIQLLEDLLPICAECKKIRDQRDTWHQLETYLTAHSNMTFTHGICPECKKQAMANFKREQLVQ